MMNLWPLVREELQRVLPELETWARQLAVRDDAMLQAEWQRRLESFKGALVIFGDAGLLELVAGLARAHAEEGDRGVHAARIARSLEWLRQLAGLDAAAAQQLLARLPTFLADAGAAPSAPPGIESGVDSRLRQLFATEVEDKTATMDRLLLQLEQQPERLELIAPLMRAAHSIKGAARAVRNEAAVALAHQLEDRLSAAQKRTKPVDDELIDYALRAVDQLRLHSRLPRAGGTAVISAAGAEPIVAESSEHRVAGTPRGGVASTAPAATPYIDAEDADPVLRVRASHLGRLIGLAGSGMVESRRLKPFAERQQRLRRQIADVARLLDGLHHRLGAPAAKTALGAEMAAIREQLNDTRHHVNDWMDDFGQYMRESFDLTERIYHSASQTRLRPFSDIAGGYPRMVRDLGRQVGKKVRAEIVGEQLAVDRDVIERIDAPLTHLLRNAIDHGIETAQRRRAAGKPEEGLIRVAASYRAGMLAIDVSDDGAGIDDALVRKTVVDKGLLGAAEAQVLEPAALHDFLFAAGFSTRDQVSEISGRGVGLDVVRQMVKQLDGDVRLSSTPGSGTRFHLLVPISRAVTRALVVRVAGESYAFPLLRIVRVVRADRAQLKSTAAMQYLALDGQNIGLVGLAEHLELGTSRSSGDQVDAVVVTQEGRTLAFAIESVVGEFDLATRPLDPRLGRVADLASLAVLPDGAPVVVLDVDDLMRGALERQRAQVAAPDPGATSQQRRRRILVVDDSISVRELERQVLGARGYEVAVAVDGMDGWTRLREWPCDLVVTDVDMPRMDGIELTRSIKQDPKLRSLPVIIVSYRDRVEDRERGLEVRADAYLTKSDFHEDGFVDVVHSLIGSAWGEA